MQPVAGRLALPGGSGGISDSGAGALLQEAQAEVALLRSELYATRRSGWEAQQALTKVSAWRVAHLPKSLVMAGGTLSRRMLEQHPAAQPDTACLVRSLVQQRK